MSDSEANGRSNGQDTLASITPLDPPAGPAPEPVRDLADACVRFVERALGVVLDYTAETLSVLDHYLRTSRAELSTRPELRPLVAHAAGAYFGEVVRRRVRSWWHLEGDDPEQWQIRLEPVYLAFSPVAMATDAIVSGTDTHEDLGTAHFVMDDEDNDMLVARLADLPPVSDDEFVALTTRLEVIDIAVDASKARMMRDGLGEVSFAPEDYTED